MAKKLHVGNLSYQTTENELRALFAEIGAVASVTLITDRVSGQPKGFGFVEMETEQAAKESIKQLNNYQLNERAITVSEARPPRERSSGGGGRNQRGGGGGGNRGRSNSGGERNRY